LVERNGLGPNAAADPIARLQDGDASAGFGKYPPSSESRGASADDEHVVVTGNHGFGRTVITPCGVCDAIATFAFIPAVNQAAPEAFFTGM
jgi:hypothetical protein